MESLRALWDLSEDQADLAKIDADLRAGVQFRGTTLWLLVVAIIIASVGLNVNSTAVIIGAMLISPLMGPILGVGYAVAISDLRLLRSSGTNLLVATGVSLAASTLYFSLSPLASAQSELLGRTHPTIFDAVIALFGGLAGIVGATRKERSNVLPGVAIATALMPPLCTAGFGLSRGDLPFFAGAFYLFVINSVFIALGTWVMSLVMAFPHVVHADARSARRARRAMLVVGALTALPSVFFAQQLVSDEVFAGRAEAFVTAAFPPDGETIVISRAASRTQARIEATVVGEPVQADRLAEVRAMLPRFGLEGVALDLHQPGSPELDLAQTKTAVVQEAFPQLVGRLEQALQRVGELERELALARVRDEAVGAMERELMALLPGATEATIALSRSSGSATAALALVTTASPLSEDERAVAIRWLGVRAQVAGANVFDRRPVDEDVTDPPAPEAGATPSPGAGSPPRP